MPKVWKVAHLTTVHPRFDPRIFLKECRSLAAVGHQVTLVVADGLPNEHRDGVNIIGVKRRPGRLERILGATRQVLRVALTVNADIYHLHDPELLTIVAPLKRANKRVIFDAHEDLPKQILAKNYLWKFLRPLVADAASLYESSICAKVDAIVAATPSIQEKFLPINRITINVNNFPVLEEFLLNPRWEKKWNEVCYIGGITKIRGIQQLVQAMGLLTTDTRLNLGGKFSEPELERSLKTEPGWIRVNELGFLDRGQVSDVLRRSIAGICTLLPAPNHLNSLPTKLFEYMAAGIPSITSHFPLWKEIVEGHRCGICVDPGDPRDIARAIDFLASNPDRAQIMGINARNAVASQYSWEAERSKLIGLYDSL